MTEQVDITISPMNIRGRVDKGTTVFEAAAQLGVALRSECGQQGTCGKCRVVVDNPAHLHPVEKVEQERLPASQLAAGHRLACRARLTGPTAVTIPSDLLSNVEVFTKTDVAGIHAVSPAVHRLHLPPESFKSLPGDGGPDLMETLAQAAQRTCSEGLHFNTRPSLEGLSTEDLRHSGATLVQHADLGVTTVHKGNQTTSLGLAMDIGTTTLAVYLCDLGTGRVLSAAAATNPQRRYGEDVIARIAAIRADEGSLAKQQVLAAATLNELIMSCLATADQEMNAVDDVTVVGNTTMEHILAGLNPGSIGLAPYHPVTCEPVVTSAGDVGLDLLRATPVYIFPVISGFLGGDILAALLADQSYERGHTTLLIDIGTNGELLLCNGPELWATSCATGPALEGAQISCGMRAAAGAVSRVYPDPAKPGRMGLETVGNADPIGICGSGIIDALAVMRKLGITRENGRFNPDSPGVHCDDQSVGRAFTLPGSSLQITLKDVRQVQLAKAALRVGIETLCKHAGITRLDRTVLTGAFGTAFNWQSARDIGLLVSGDQHGEVANIPNLAGTGAIMALLNRHQRTEIETRAPDIHFLDLAAEPDFTTRFAAATRFPKIHTKA